MPADPLALAVTRLPGFAPVAGMRLLRKPTIHHGSPALRVLFVGHLLTWVVDEHDTAEPPFGLEHPARSEWPDAALFHRYVPDLDDEPTGGCLLAMLVEAWEARCPGGWVEVAHRPGRARVTLRNAAGQASTLAGEADYYGSTLARACAAALVAVGRCA